MANSVRHNLARIPLRWMIRQCFLTNTGIRFHADLLRTVGLDPGSLYPIVKERPPALFYSPSLATPTATINGGSTQKLVNGNNSNNEGLISYGYNGVHPDLIMSEEEEDLADALCPIYDQLKVAPYWWILELIPMKLRQQQDDSNEWFSSLTFVIVFFPQRVLENIANTQISQYSVNLGRPRRIPRQKRHGIKVHRSVKIRMEAGKATAGGPYTPQAKWKVEPTWED